jgi:hypothetical protein
MSQLQQLGGAQASSRSSFAALKNVPTPPNVFFSLLNFLVHKINDKNKENIYFPYLNF